MRGRLWAGRLLIGAAVMSMLCACQSSASPSAPPASPSGSVGAAPGSEAAVAGRWMAALQAKDLPAMAALFAPDAVWEDGATGEKFGGGQQAERSGWAAALGMVISVNDATVLAVGDGVAVVAYTLHGPTPASSSPIDVPMIAVLRVKDSSVIRETIYYNPRLAYGS